MENTQLTAIATSEFENANNLQHSSKRLLFMLFAFLLSLAAAAIVAFHGYIAWFLSRPVIEPLSSNPLDAVGLSYETVSFSSSDQSSTLEGWYIPAQGSSRSVIFSHGYGGNREELWVPFYQLAEMLHQNLYNVLLFDYGYVQPGLPITGGVRESRELQGAIDFVKSRGNDQVYIWGFSMGAGTALQTALYSTDIAAMILDSTFLLEPDTLYLNIRKQIALPKFPSLPLIRLFFPIVSGTSLNNIPYEKVKQTSYNVPIFFIHGEKDAKAPYEIVTLLYENQKSTPHSSLWLIPDGQHELLYRQLKEDYVDRALSFFRSVQRNS